MQLKHIKSGQNKTPIQIRAHVPFCFHSIGAFGGGVTTGKLKKEWVLTAQRYNSQP